jgi:hypothetical protein
VAHVPGREGGGATRPWVPGGAPGNLVVSAPWVGIVVDAALRVDSARYSSIVACHGRAGKMGMPPNMVAPVFGDSMQFNICFG